jgi:MoxR-like ATPase
MTPAFQYQTYGSSVNSQEVASFLMHVLGQAFAGDFQERPTPVCIWGKHGIGKTQLVKEVAQQAGCPLVMITPAQFEEMGDLIGMPALEEQNGRTVTRLQPPAWVPVQEGPGILLIDDVNRADDRILRGIMQLLQDYALVSWQLPRRWQIILTANPDGGDYSVTPMDHAILTRMQHITMEWDAESWVKWAGEAAIDIRGIQFVKAHPDLAIGERTTPRSLVHFFRQLEGMDDLEENWSLVRMLSEANLDSETATAFLSFARLQMKLLIDPGELLKIKDFLLLQEKLEALITADPPHIDVIAILFNRMVRLIQKEPKRLDLRALTNLKATLRLQLIPEDLRFGLARDLIALKLKKLDQLLQDPEIAQLL